MPADPDANTRFTAMDKYVGKFGLTLQRVTGRFHVKGGPALALLRSSGHFVVQLRIATDKDDKEPDMHCVAYDGFTVMDNYKWCKPRILDERDRESEENARDVFDSLFKGNGGSHQECVRAGSLSKQLGK